MKHLEINSLAKINFGLNVISKLDDGFHDIETIFYPVNLFDKISIRNSSEFIFDSNIQSLKSDPSNLVIRAKEKLEQFLNDKLCFEIFLEKNIPIGAGLGGGSSNCAAILKGLIDFFHLNISSKKLFEIASELGSDVPYFLNPIPSFASSRGEKISGINFHISQPILIVNPGIHISTKWAYENIRPKVPNFSLRSFNQNILQNKLSLRNNIVNDFEKPVFDKFPEIAEIKSKLYYFGAHFSLMTGSGSTLFALFNDLNSAKKAEAFFQQNYFTFIHNEKY